MIRIVDETDENSGTEITEEMFGLNALITAEAFDDPVLNERYEELGVTNLRYPGGSVTEWFFDISDVANESYDNTVGTFEGNEKELIPFSSFLSLAADLGVSATIVLPTINGFTKTAGEALLNGDFGNRTIDQEYLEDIAEFVQAAVKLAEEKGVRIDALEIGNEFFASGRMTASEYGELATAMAQVVADTLVELGIPSEDQPDIVVQTLSSAGTYTPNGVNTLYVDGETNYVYEAYQLKNLEPEIYDRLVEVTVESQGSAREQVLNIIQSFQQDSLTVMDESGELVQLDVSGAADAIDGVVDHYYVDGGFEAVNTEEQYGFNQLELWNGVLELSNGANADLDYYVTEWNTRKNGDIEIANNRGLEQVSMNIEMFYEMVTHEITAAHFWPVIFEYNNSGTLVDRSGDKLTIAGEGFALMSGALIGLKPILDFGVEDSFSMHGFGDEDTLVYFLSERSGLENQLNLDFSTQLIPGAEYYQVSWTELSDGGAGGTDQYADPVISHTEVMYSMSADELEEFLITLQPNSIIRLDIQVIGEVDAVLSEIEGRFITGGNADDTLEGGSKNDIFEGGRGNDDISGYWGNDKISGGSGNDKIKGGWGNDTLNGGSGDDRLIGDWGSDSLLGGDGKDRLEGGDGDDFLTGGAGNDILIGGSGSDIIQGNEGSDTAIIDALSVEAYVIVGDDGSIALVSSEGTDSYIGVEFFQFNDKILTLQEVVNELESVDVDVDTDISDPASSPSMVDIMGTAGNDMINGSDAAENYSAGNGFDTIYAGSGDDVLDGGDHADRLHGGAGDDLIKGGAGFDVLFGESGNDTLLGGSKPDRLFGDDGDDLLYAGSNAGSTVDGLFGGAGNDTLYGETGFDYLEGGTGDDLLDGGDQADNLFGGSGNDTLRGGQGLDRLMGGEGDDFGRGGSGNDGLFGQEGHDTLNGESGEDRLFGGFGDDYLDGAAGDDSLFGGAGFDTLKGGMGDDFLSGNFNADTFVFHDGEGHDTIGDFDATNDFEKIDLRGVSAIIDMVDLTANHLVQTGSDVVIDLGEGSSVTLVGVNLTDLESSDFLF